MRFDHEVTINAPLNTVWGVYADVEHWPEWTASIRSCELLDGHELALGTRARIEQPKLPRAEWTVTSLTPGRAWTWEAKAPGVRTTATHELDAVDDSTTVVRTSIEQAGPIGAVIGIVSARLTRRYLAMEADGLKARSESRRTA